MQRYANVAMPDARRFARRVADAPHEEVRALLNVLRRNVTGPDGQKPTIADIATLLGLAESTLQNYTAPPRTDRSRAPRGVPYVAVYALEVMVSCPECVASILWGEQPDE
mgnify:FL=1